MKWNILHESRGRISLHLNKPRLSMAEADQLQAYLADLPGVRVAVVYERTCDAVITYTGARTDVLHGAAAFRFDVQALTEVSANSPRAVNHEYQEKLVREASESKNVYRGNAIFGGAISQNGSSQTGSDANRSTSQPAAAGNVGESTNANSAAQAGGMAVSSTGKAYYNPGKERSKLQKKVKKAEEDLAV